MKRIEAFVKPFTIEAIKGSLHDAGVSTIRILEARELSRHEKYAEVYSGTEYEVDVAPRVLLIAYIEDDRLSEVVKIISDSAQTETNGDGHIFVSSLESVLDLDTGKSV